MTGLLILVNQCFRESIGILKYFNEPVYILFIAHSFGKIVGELYRTIAVCLDCFDDQR